MSYGEQEALHALRGDQPERLGYDPRSDRRASRQHRSKQRSVVAGFRRNVGTGERAMSLVAGSILAGVGLARRDLTGYVVAGVGGALALRGATGHCSVYQTLGVNTAPDGDQSLSAKEAERGIHIRVSYLINKSPELLYSYWWNLENLPHFMSHLESVRKMSERKSHWVAKAPRLYGGQVEWDAEITADEPNKRIAWQSLPGGDVEHRGSIQFTQALADRGTMVRVELEYQPPGGQVGRWLAKLFGEEPEQQIREDLRNFKRIMELGEILTIDGQPRGTCLGRGVRSKE